ncbi:hypothetical protein FQZ97_722300 [compost metagenome]
MGKCSPYWKAMPDTRPVLAMVGIGVTPASSKRCQNTGKPGCPAMAARTKPCSSMRSDGLPVRTT